MESVYQNKTTRDYIRIIFRQKMVILSTILSVVIATAVAIKFKTPIYEAKVKMLISAEKQVESPYYRELGVHSPAVLTQSEIVKSGPVIEGAVKALGLYARPLDYEKDFASSLKKPFIVSKARSMERMLNEMPKEQRKELLFRWATDDLKAHVKVESVKDTNLFSISVIDFNPVGAAIIANTVSRSYVIFDLQQQLAEMQLKYGSKHPTAMQLYDNIQDMVKNLSGQPLPALEAIGPASVKIIEQANMPLSPLGPNKKNILMLATFMSVLLGAMLAFLIDYLDMTFKTPDDIHANLGLQYLGSIPENAKLNAYHELADEVYLTMKDRSIKSLLLTSALPHDGVINTACNLGTCLALNHGHSVLIIDADLRNPTVHKLFGKPSGPGLSEVLEGKAAFEDVLHKAGANLDIMPAGKTMLNPLALLGSHNMENIIKRASKDYETVFITSHPLNGNKDIVALSGFSDAVAIVINEGRTRRHVVKEALAPLEEKKVKIIGAILNNRTFPIPKLIYHRV